MKAEAPERNLIRLLRRLSTRDSRAMASDARLVAQALSRGLLANTPRGPELTDYGRVFLRRALSAGVDFTAQHQDRETVSLDDEALGRRAVTINHAESPLAWLRRRRGKDGRPMVDAAEFAAGERLRADYERGQLMPRVTANWDAGVPGNRGGGARGAADLTEVALAARMRVERAISAIDPDLGGLLVDFCCHLKGLEQIERERRWPLRSAKIVLGLGLRALARHYGLAAAATGPARRKIVHWGSDDYRPTID
jgi:hypothetical protein